MNYEDLLKNNLSRKNIWEEKLSNLNDSIKEMKSKEGKFDEISYLKTSCNHEKAVNKVSNKEKR